MATIPALKRKKFLDWLRKLDVYIDNQPLQVIEFVFESFSNLVDDDEIKVELKKVGQRIRKRVEDRDSTRSTRT